MNIYIYNIYFNWAGQDLIWVACHHGVTLRSVSVWQLLQSMCLSLLCGENKKGLWSIFVWTLVRLIIITTTFASASPPAPPLPSSPPSQWVWCVRNTILCLCIIFEVYCLCCVSVISQSVLRVWALYWGWLSTGVICLWCVSAIS